MDFNIFLQGGLSQTYDNLKLRPYLIKPVNSEIPYGNWNELVDDITYYVGKKFEPFNHTVHWNEPTTFGYTGTKPRIIYLNVGSGGDSYNRTFRTRLRAFTAQPYLSTWVASRAGVGFIFIETNDTTTKKAFIRQATLVMITKIMGIDPTNIPMIGNELEIDSWTALHRSNFSTVDALGYAQWSQWHTPQRLIQRMKSAYGLIKPETPLSLQNQSPVTQAKLIKQRIITSKDARSDVFAHNGAAFEDQKSKFFSGFFSGTHEVEYFKMLLPKGSYRIRQLLNRAWNSEGDQAGKQYRMCKVKIKLLHPHNEVDKTLNELGAQQLSECNKIQTINEKVTALDDFFPMTASRITYKNAGIDLQRAQPLMESDIKDEAVNFSFDILYPTFICIEVKPDNPVNGTTAYSSLGKYELEIKNMTDPLAPTEVSRDHNHPNCHPVQNRRIDGVPVPLSDYSTPASSMDPFGISIKENGTIRSIGFFIQEANDSDSSFGTDVTTRRHDTVINGKVTQVKYVTHPALTASPNAETRDKKFLLIIESSQFAALNYDHAFREFYIANKDTEFAIRPA